MCVGGWVGKLILKPISDTIISLVHRKVFPLWFSSCLALETAVGIVLKRPVSERACDLFYNKVYQFNGSRLFL